MTGSCTPAYQIKETFLCEMYRQFLLFSLLWSGGLGLPTGEVLGDMNDDVSLHVFSLHPQLTGLQFNVTTPAAPGIDTPCEDYHNLNSSREKCEFIRTTNSCQNSDGFINYLQVIYCSFPNVRPLGFVCLGLWLIYLLITLGVTAEDFFCPNLVVMARTLKMSQNIASTRIVLVMLFLVLTIVQATGGILYAILLFEGGEEGGSLSLLQIAASAGGYIHIAQQWIFLVVFCFSYGVTLLAFGNGAPDIFSAISAVTNARNGKAGLAIGALFGAGIFVTTVVAGSIAVTKPFKMVERPFLRDSIFYLVAAFWTFYVLYKGSIVLFEAVGFLLLYILYVIVVFVGRRIYQHRKRRRQEQEQPPETYANGNQDCHGHGDISTVLHPSLDSSHHIAPRSPSINVIHVPSINSSIDDVLLVNGALPTRGDLSATQRLAIASIVGVDGNVARSITPQPHHAYDPDSNDNYESQPLLGGSSESPLPGQVKEFFIGLCPVDMKVWAESAWYSKIWEIIKCPMVFCLKATIPVVDYSEPKHNWNRLLNILNLLLAPIFCAFVTKGLTKTITGSFLVWHLILAVSFLFAAVIFLTSKSDKQPVYHSMFSYIGFIVAVLWIYSTANEIVNILQMFGVEFFIRDAILGLTVLAWGNSIGDLVADVTMAKQGSPTMGMSACFGGPLFNMLLGIGISCTIVTIRDEGTFLLETSHVQFVLALGLAVSLLSSMFFMLITKFQATKYYGVYLYILYCVFLVAALLIELDVIPW